MIADAYQAARDRVRDAVLAVVRETAPQVEARGSFYYGDFHFSSRDHSTLSDLDLVWPAARADDTQVLADRITRELHARTGLCIRTSIQPERNFETLSVADARFLAVGEYLRWAPHSSVHSEAASLLRAKIALLLARQSTGQRYADVAADVGTPTSRLALAVKLGSAAEEFSIDDLVAMSGHLEHEPSWMVLRACLTDPRAAGGRRTYVDELLGRSTVSEWLRMYLAGRLA